MTEMERTINTLGARQDDLNEKVELTNELVLEDQMEKENAKMKKMMEMKFPKFNPNLSTLDLDPPNIFTPPSKTKKPSDGLIHLLLILNLLFSTFAHSHE